MRIKNPKIGPYQYFVYPNVRKDQDRLIEDLDEFLSSNIKIALIKGDTGLGKEAALASQIVKHRNKFDHIVHVIPTDMGKINIEKELNLIKEKFPEISLPVVVLHNKGMMCYLLKEARKQNRFKEKEINVYDLCDRQECMVNQKGKCEYYQTIEKIEKSKIIICDYNYVFDPYIRKAIFGDMFEKKDVLLLINEVHELPDRITSQFSFSISSNIFAHAISELSGKYLKEGDREKFMIKFGSMKKDIEFVRGLEGDFKSFLINSYDRFYGTTDNKIEVKLNNLLENNPVKYKRLINVGNDMIRWKIKNNIGTISHTKVLGMFLQQVRYTSGLDYYFSYVEKENNNSYNMGIACMNPYPLIKEPFDNATKVIMYSGTLYPERYMRLFMLGKFGEVFMPEPYRAEYLKNRVDLFYSDGRLTKEVRDSRKLRKSADELNVIIKEIPKPCAIFVVSPLWRKIKPMLNFRRYKMIEEIPGSDKRELFSKIRKADIAVLSPYGSFKQSVDMSFLQSVIILGICDPMLDLITRKTLDYYKEKFLKTHGIKSDWIAYELICRLPAIEKSLQATGRGIRKEKDRLLAVWFDERWINQSRFIAGENKKNCMNLPSLLKEIEVYKKV